MALKVEQGLGNWEIATAKKLVTEYRRRHRILQREEFDDLMQECLAHWIVVRRRIPPEPDPRPPVAYMAQVLRNKLSDLVREMTADQRAGDPGAFSLEAPSDGNEDGLTLGDVLAGEQAAPDSGGIDSQEYRQTEPHPPTALERGRIIPTQTPTVPAIPWRHWARPREGRLVPSGLPTL